MDRFARYDRGEICEQCWLYAHPTVGCGRAICPMSRRVRLSEIEQQTCPYIGSNWDELMWDWTFRPPARAGALDEG